MNTHPKFLYLHAILKEALNKLKRAGKLLWTAFIWGIVPLVGIEAYLLTHELWINETSGYHVFSPNTLVKFASDPEIYPGIKGMKMFRTNEAGFRGKDTGKNEAEMLFIGGSTTICSQLDDAETWPHLTAQMVGRGKGQSFNGLIAARGGLYSDHYPLLLSKALQSSSKIRYAFLMPGANDLEVWAKNEGFKEYDRRMLELTAFEKQPLLAGNFPKWIRSFQLRDLLLIEHLRRLKYRLFAGLGWSSVTDGSESTVPQQRAWRSRANKVEPDSGKLRELSLYLQRYEENLQSFVDICRQYGVQAVFLSQPILYSPQLDPAHKKLWRNGALNASYSAPLPDTPYLSESAMFEVLSQFNRLTGRVAAENQIMFIDLAEEINGQADLYWDQWHFNEAGAQRVANIISARFLDARYSTN